MNLKAIAEINQLSKISSLTPTVCALLEIPNLLPTSCHELEQIISLKKTNKIQKILIYAPDAIGVNVHLKYPEIFTKLNTPDRIQVELQSVIPPKTPVCYASIFTGVEPSSHGITKYEKPVLKISTLFDSLIAAGLKVAIVAVKNSSIDLIFRNREMEYYSLENDNEVTLKASELINSNAVDVIVAYHQEYDDLLHAFGPYSNESKEALIRHVETFLSLEKCVQAAWKQFNFATLFVPDHGGHDDLNMGRGDHGVNIPEDMHLFHYYKLKYALE